MVARVVPMEDDKIYALVPEGYSWNYVLPQHPKYDLI